MAEGVIRPWPPSLTQLTADDVIASGACESGVSDWIKSHRIRETAVSVETLLKRASASDAQYIRCAAGLSGNGDGYGDGYGYGDGDGYGDGYGYGYGYGDGDGDGGY